MEGELGDAKLLIDKKTGKVEFMLRKENTMKILCNFWNVNAPAYCELKPDADGRSNGETKLARLALKCASEGMAMQFKAAFELAKAWELPRVLNNGCFFVVQSFFCFFASTWWHVATLGV